MRLKPIKLYDFNELSTQAKNEAITKWYEHEDYAYMETDLFESLKALLEQHKIHVRNEEKFEQYYSLSYSQGDGYYFIGKFKWKGYYVTITHHSNHYYHKNTVMFYIETNYGNPAKQKVYNDFRKLYDSICDELEKEGYGILEYRMSHEEFNDLCEANDYTFLENGIMENL